MNPHLTFEIKRHAFDLRRMERTPAYAANPSIRSHRPHTNIHIRIHHGRRYTYTNNILWVRCPCCYRHILRLQHSIFVAIAQ